MKIFSNKTSKFNKSPFFGFSKISARKFRFIVPAVTLISIAVIIGTYKPKAPPSTADKVIRKSALILNPKLGEFFAGSIFFQSSLLHSFLNWSKSIATINPKLVLDIPLDAYSNLSVLRDNALRQGLNLDKNDWFKSTLRTSYSSQRIPIKLRLKVILLISKDGRWSFELKLGKMRTIGNESFQYNQPLQGHIYMNQFSKIFNA